MDFLRHLAWVSKPGCIFLLECFIILMRKTSQIHLFMWHIPASYWLAWQQIPYPLTFFKQWGLKYVRLWATDRYSNQLYHWGMTDLCNALLVKFMKTKAESQNRLRVRFPTSYWSIVALDQKKFQQNLSWGQIIHPKWNIKVASITPKY